MAQVSYPGVYVQEVPSGVRTITAVSTSVAAFFGRATKGPINKAARILSFADFDRQFGEPHPKSDLAYSVRQFFKNGGTDCYVIRLARNAEAAAVRLEDLAGQEVLVATAKAKGAWGNTVRLAVDYNTPRPDETFNLRVIHEQAGTVVATESFTGLSMDPSSPRFAPAFVTDSSALISLALAAAMGDPSAPTSFINTIGNSFAGFSNGRRPLGSNAGQVQTAFNDLIAAGQTDFQISVNASTPVTVNLAVAPAIPGDTIPNIQTNLADKINNALAGVSPAQTVAVTLPNVTSVGRLLTIAATSGDQATVHVSRAGSNDAAAALMLGVDQAGVESSRWSNFRPAPTASILRLGDPATPGSLGTLNAVAGLQQDAITQITVGGVVQALNADPFNLVTSAAGDRWFQNAAGNSAVTDDNDGVREKLRIIARAISNNADMPYQAEVWGYQLALTAISGTINAQPTFPGGGATGTAAFDNGLIANVRQYTLGSGGTGAFSSNPVDGDDGVVPDAATYFGNENDQTGFHALDPVDLFNLMVLPGDEELDETVHSSLWGPASVYCKAHRAFLLVDPPTAWTRNGRPEVVQDTAVINDLRATLEKDHSAVFYPRLTYSRAGVSKVIGPAGAIAGLMARTDATRGVWKAPAGIEAGLRDILGLNLELTDAENGVLNKKGVNAIRIFPNGIVSWGSRTLDGDDDFGSEWKYIPVRRLALMLAESLYRGTRWAVFEPNDEPLWANIRLNIGAFMTSLFRQGAFQGTSPQEAFYVKCDKETTTQDDRNKGIVNIEVGFSPLKPAEFVVIKLQQMAGEL